MLFALLCPLALLGACDKVPLLAPTGTAITILPAATTVSLNSQLTIVATVIEHGTSSGGTGNTTTTSTGGTPVQNGTLISFTTSIGHIEPAEARTHNGQVNVTLFTEGQSGTATITAYSGGASTTNNDIKVGTAAVKTLTVITTPQTIAANGGTASVTASALDESGNKMSGVPVNFTTDKGSISPSTANTDGSGNATVTLTTTSTAKVTASAGTISGTATVVVNGRSLASFTTSAAGATVAVPIIFTVAPVSGANISNVHVDFGDGSEGQDLGAITQSSTPSRAYCSPGQYTATATATDATGDRQSLSTNVIIGALPAILNAAPSSPTVGTPVTFSVTGLGSAQVSKYTWSWDDGTASFSTTAPQTPHTFNRRGQATIRVDVYGIGCGGPVATSTVVLNVS